MLWSWRWTPVAGNIVEDSGDAFDDAMLLGKLTTFTQRDPCALVLPISTLDLFMDTLLHLSFKDSCSCGFVEAGDLENVCCVDPVVGSSSHDMVTTDLQLIDWHLRSQLVSGWATTGEGAVRTLLYVAE